MLLGVDFRNRFLEEDYDPIEQVPNNTVIMTRHREGDIGPLHYEADHTVCDDDIDKIVFYTAYSESIRCHGHRVVDKAIGQMLPFRLIVVKDGDLKMHSVRVRHRGICSTPKSLVCPTGIFP